jgi:hypothetical protein
VGGARLAGGGGRHPRARVKSSGLGASSSERGHYLLSAAAPLNAPEWRTRIEREPKLAALDDAPRSGRPVEVPVEVRCTIVKLACDRLADVPFRDARTLAALRDAAEEETGFETRPKKRPAGG